MSKNKSYTIDFNGCHVTVSENGKVGYGGLLTGFEFSCECKKVKAVIGGITRELYWNDYVGPLDHNGWKDSFSCSDSVEETELEKTFEGTDWYYENTDTKQRNPIPFDKWFDGTTWCYVSVGEIPAEDGSNLINIENYILMNNAGTVIPENLSGFTTPGCVTVVIAAGSTITLADILAEAVADGILLPDGTAPTGLLNFNITAFQIGQLAKDAAGTKIKVGSQAVAYDNDEMINAGSTYCPPARKLVDNDGDCFTEGEDLTKTIENCSTKEPAAIRFCADFIPLDADDTDDAVQ